MGCKQFFSIKAIDPTNQVAYMAWNLQDPRIQDWYSNDAAHLKALTFDAFLHEVRSVWLPSNWDALLRQRMLNSTQGTRTFNEWSIEIKTQNTMLRGTDSHLNDNALRFHLEARMSTNLLRKYRSTTHTKEAVFRTWLNNVRKLDEELQGDLKKQRAVIEDALRAAGRAYTTPSCLPAKPTTSGYANTLQI